MTPSPSMHFSLTKCSLGTWPPHLLNRKYFVPRRCCSHNQLYDFGNQLACTSIVLGVVLGDMAPLTTTLRNFYLADWLHMEAALHSLSSNPLPVLPSMLGWVQLQMASHSRGINSGWHLPLPQMEHLYGLFLQQQYLVPLAAANCSNTGCTLQGSNRVLPKVTTVESARTQGPGR